MIREFFSPRVAIVFVVLWCIFASVLLVWLRASGAKHRRWIRIGRIPVTAAILSALMCAAIVVVLNFL